MREECYMRVKPFPAKFHCSHSGRSLTFQSVSEQTPPLPPHHRPSLLSVCPLSVLQEEPPSLHRPPVTPQVAWDVMKAKEEKKKRDVPLGLAPKRLLRPQRQLPSIKERAWPEWSGRWLKADWLEDTRAWPLPVCPSSGRRGVYGWLSLLRSVNMWSTERLK